VTQQPSSLDPESLDLDLAGGLRGQSVVVVVVASNRAWPAEVLAHISPGRAQRHQASGGRRRGVRLGATSPGSPLKVSTPPCRSEKRRGVARGARSRTRWCPLSAHSRHWTVLKALPLAPIQVF